jgi:protoporphyrinogen oxidase
VLGARVRSVSAIPGENGARMLVEYNLGGQSQTIEAHQVWSTIPVTLLGRMLTPPPPGEVLQAAGQIDFRAMILIYLTLDTPQFSEYDAHYFPEAHIRISRLSEPKNYSASSQPAGQTVLCAELPLATSDPEWSMSDAELGRLMTEALASAGLPVTVPVVEVQTRRLRNAYPIYQRGFEAPFMALDEWLDGVDNLLTFGRQGLFAHDNTHHALYMAYCAVECLDETGNFDRARWHAYRRIFETHVVED